MSDDPQVLVKDEQPPNGFVTLIEQQTNDEAERVLAELKRLQFDAQQVTRIMRALNLPVDVLLSAVADADDRAATKAYVDARVGRVADGEEFAPDPAPAGIDTDAPAPAATKLEDPVLLSVAKKVEPAKRKPAKPKGAKKSPPPAGADRAREQGETNRQKVLDGVAAAGKAGIRLGDLTSKIGLSQPPTSKHIRALLAEGLVAQPGPRGSEYVAVTFLKAPAVPPTPATEPPSSQKTQPEPDSALVGAVRDLVVKAITRFTGSDVRDALPDALKGASITDVAAALLKLEGKGVVRLNGHGYYEYVKPTDEGEAARKDREKHKEMAKGEARIGRSLAGGLPVAAGTGGGLRIGNADVRALVAEAESAGATVRKANGKGGHLIVAFKGKQVSIASTPSTAGVREDRANLRRAGLAV